MNGINLLPWRLERYRHLLFLFLIKLLAVLGIALGLYLGLSLLQQRQQDELTQLQQHFEQQKKGLTQSVQQIAQIKQTLQNFTELQGLESDKVEKILSLLPQLPFEQGELDTFYFNAEGLRLEGFCLTQSEFEALHEFLSAHFEQVKLSQFKTEQGRLVFQFDLGFHQEAKKK